GGAAPVDVRLCGRQWIVGGPGDRVRGPPARTLRPAGGDPPRRLHGTPRARRRGTHAARLSHRPRLPRGGGVARDHTSNAVKHPHTSNAVEREHASNAVEHEVKSRPTRTPG